MAKTAPQANRLGEILVLLVVVLGVALILAELGVNITGELNTSQKNGAIPPRTIMPPPTIDIHTPKIPSPGPTPRRDEDARRWTVEELG